MSLLILAPKAATAYAIAAKTFQNMYHNVTGITVNMAYENLMTITVKLLGASPDFSMHETLLSLKKSAPVNPKFEITLKRNLCNNYCLQAAFEPATIIYTKEAVLGFNWLMSSTTDKTELKQQREALLDEFWQTPLCEIITDRGDELSKLISAAEKAITQAETILFP